MLWNNTEHSTEHDMTRNGKQNGFLKRLLASTAALLLIVALAGSEAAWAQKKKVYRWVDEQGNVHYSETLPPDWEGETHDELRGDGIVSEEGVSHAPPPVVEEPDPEADKGELPRDKSGLRRPEPLYSDTEKQQRMDSLLMLRYHSEEEMAQAMEVEINQLKYDERLLNATHDSLVTSLRSNIDVAGNRQRAGLQVGDDLLKKIAGIRSSLKENESSLRGLKIRENNIREDFNRDIERYRELSEMYSEVEQDS